MAKVDRSDADGCWLWTGTRNDLGYGSFKPSPEAPGIVGAHRWSFERFIGPIPAGLGVLHRCDNPPCVKPAHLFAGDQGANVDDCRSKGRLGYEPRGGTSQFVGVWYDGTRRRWVAHLCHRDIRVTIGRFATEAEAARARDAYVVAHGLPHKLNLGVRS